MLSFEVLKNTNLFDLRAVLKMVQNQCFRQFVSLSQLSMCCARENVPEIQPVGGFVKFKNSSNPKYCSNWFAIGLSGRNFR